MSHRYPTPEAFRQALEQRLRNANQRGEDLVRQRQLVVFDRFLARIDTEFGASAVLKGGLVLEYRTARSRTTKDVDLRLSGAPSDTLDRLRKAGSIDHGDFMHFEVAADATHPTITSPGMRYDGLRFQVKCLLGGRLYGQGFGVDIGYGDPMHGALDLLTGLDLLRFAGLAPGRLRLYPLETHIAEKLHAYTLPRTRPNSRVKDLPDLALLGTVRELELATLRTALRETFAFRGTHPLPTSVPSPPSTWHAIYAAMAREDGLPWPTIEDLVAAVQSFLAPVLRGDAAERWAPSAWRWS